MSFLLTMLMLMVLVPAALIFVELAIESIENMIYGDLEEDEDMW